MLSIKNFELEDFLANYWQKKPLLIRGGLADFEFPLMPDDLAGMACEEEVESRLIVGGVDSGYESSSGPFDEQLFATLPEKDWTLLVQAVDHFIPEVAALLEHFRFIPNWRVDDVMVSYASEGGNVGPHYDNYDVFLVQGLGLRDWQIGQFCDEQTALVEHDSLKLIEDFQCQQQWTLQPGDILYVPPRCAHWGKGRGDSCMTYSVGFRAPSHGEILSHFCDEQLADSNDFVRYTDPALTIQDNPGEISELAIDQVQQILKSFVDDKQAVEQWFGRYMTEPKYPELHEEEPEQFDVQELDVLLAESEFLYRNPSSRFAFIENDDQLSLYVDGREFCCRGDAQELAKLLCANTQLKTLDLPFRLKDTDLFKTLFNQGAIYIDEIEDETDN
ncbi:cupin domain-containing protein [uncultured Paraglaciecola sp.]|uniref:cupin domain-containing protein n=1 Tax=uncultured Paraglaciecola sp. TaxID=1765024 RepID=UPI00261EB27E|nr:cupin domain-containing protein [uncultured Paraglaciecola sp.]